LLMCYLTQRGADKLKSLLMCKAVDEDINEALQGLDQLTQDELRNVTAQTLGAVSGEQTNSACSPMSTEYPSQGEDTGTFCRQQGASLSD